MPVGYYVHNILREESNATKAFSGEIIKRQLQAQQRQLHYKQKKIADKYNEIFANAKDYVTLLEEIENSFSSTILKQLVTDLPTISFAPLYAGVATGNTVLLQKAIADMKQDLEKYENFYTECTKVATSSKKPQWISTIDLERLGKQAARIKEAKLKLDQIQTSSNPWGLTRGIATAAQTVAGFISESATAKLANIEFSNSMINIGNGLSLRVTTEGATSGKKGKKGYKVQTTDLAINIVDDKGEIQFTVPGISLKRTSSGSKKNPMYKIHIKSSSIGTLIENAGLRTNSAFNLNTFYNYYANHGRTTHEMGADNKVVTNKVTGMNQMYKAFHASMLLTALVGGFKAEEMAYYLAINDTLYSADQILEMALTGDASIGAGITQKLTESDILSGKNTTLHKAQPAIANLHSILFAKYKDPDRSDSIESQQRSNEIIAAINGISLNLNLNLSLKI